MPDGLVTSRTLQNEATGIDLLVPLYQEVHGAMMTGHVEYQIIVITRMVAFKSPRHRPGDVVQLMVSKKYSEMDEFYNRLIARYPNFPLPAMPRKTLFVGECDIRERRGAFDDLMKAIAKHPTLATCSDVMEFLGAKSYDVDMKTRNVLLGEEPVEEEEENFFLGDEALAPSTRRLAAQPRKPSHIKENENKTNGDDEEEEKSEEPYLGPLGNPKSIPKKAKPRLKPKPSNAPLFGDDEPVDTDFFHYSNKEGHFKLFEDPVLGGRVNMGDSLLLPTAQAQQAQPSAALFSDEETDTLFRIQDDFDELLQVTKRNKNKPSTAPKPNLKPKPTRLANSSAGAGPLAVDQLKGQIDILKYIQQNESDGTKEEDLF